MSFKNNLLKVLNIMLKDNKKENTDIIYSTNLYYACNNKTYNELHNNFKYVNLVKALIKYNIICLPIDDIFPDNKLFIFDNEFKFYSKVLDLNKYKNVRLLDKFNKLEKLFENED